MKRLISDLDVRIGSWLRDERLARGLSQKEIAHIMGFSFQQVQKIEMGHNRLSASRLFILADSLDVDPKAVMHLVLESPGRVGRLSDCTHPPILREYSKLTAVNQKLVLGLAEALAAAEPTSRPARQFQSSPIEAPAENESPDACAQS